MPQEQQLLQLKREFHITVTALPYLLLKGKKDGQYFFVCPKSAFPYDNDTEAKGHHVPMISLISFFITSDLLSPEFSVAFNLTVKSAAMAMPETAVHINCDPVSGKHYVRPPWITFIVFPITIAKCEEVMTQKHLNAGITRSDAPHYDASVLPRENIHGEIIHPTIEALHPVFL